jgi:hypothetical protein
MLNHLCLPFTGFAPDVQELPNFLPRVGFMPLINATREELHSGIIVVLYNIYTYSFEIVVVDRLEDGYLYYSHQTGRDSDTWYRSFIGDPVCYSYLYKVIS